MNREFEEIGSDPSEWGSKRKVTLGAILGTIMIVALVVATTGNVKKNEPADVLQRQAFEDSHSMYEGLPQVGVEDDLSLAEEEYPQIWTKVKADATSDGFTELVMCGNTPGGHYFWNEWNGGAATLRNAARTNRIVVRMYDQHGRRVQSNGQMTNGGVWSNVRANKWINNSPVNGNVGAAKHWVNQNFGGNAYLKDRMWWGCHTNRHQNLGAGRVYWACGHGSHGGGGLHVDKVAKVCVWKWQSRNRPDHMDQFFLFYKKTGPVEVHLAPFYRYWNGGAGDHFYTTNPHEIGTVTPGHTGKHGYKSEGIACYISPHRYGSLVPLYRYWQPHNRDHFYTTNAAEIGTTTHGRTGKHGYISEGISGYCSATHRAGSVKLYRYWNPTNTDHFYTTNWGELGGGRHGWHYEGVQCYVWQRRVVRLMATAAMDDDANVPDEEEDTWEETHFHLAAQEGDVEDAL